MQRQEFITKKDTQDNLHNSIHHHELPNEILIECEEGKLSHEQSYEANEHADIGNFAFSLFLEKLADDNIKIVLGSFITLVNPSDKSKWYKLYDPYKGKMVEANIYEFAITNEFKLTPGNIVALAGDFFADANAPISFGKDLAEQKTRFKTAYTNLFNPAVDVQHISDLINHIRDDAEAANVHSHWTVKFKKVIKTKLDINNVEYAIESATEKSLAGFWHSPYFKMALTNFDHFGKEARSAFLAGHHLAIESAQKAGSEADPDKRKGLLKEALLQELFACHFLTDLFAAGHIRTPRKELLNYLVGSNHQHSSTSSSTAGDISQTLPDLSKVSDLDLTVAGFLARKMHDEEGENGVMVGIPGSDNGPWEACGDGNYYRPNNTYNAQKACEAMLTGLTDLVLAYQQKLEETKLDKALHQYVPIPSEEANKEEGRDPLFFVEGNQVKCRGGTECSQLNLVMMSHRFFKVKLPQVKESAAQTAVTIQKTAVQTANDLQEATTEQLEQLRVALAATQARCTIL